MSPHPEASAVLSQSSAKIYYVAPKKGDEIVISGMAGFYPEAEDTQTFIENLFEKKDMITLDDRRWNITHPEVPNHMGKISEVEKFDAQFFAVHYKQAWTMDPSSRKLLECAFGAIYDAGLNPQKLRHTNTGVFIGAASSEYEKTWMYEQLQINGFGIPGVSRTMFANRISYWLGTTGPSLAVDGADASFMTALQSAYDSIRTERCEAAIVGAGNCFSYPQLSLQFYRAGLLSKDGVTRVFDKKANGYARSEGVTVFFLQKAKHAQRAYAEVVHANQNFNRYKSTLSGQSPVEDAKSIAEFLKIFYGQINIPPQVVEYIEAHGSGVPESDQAELLALEEVFLKDRKTPLLIGSVKSNAGHGATASGGFSLTKMCAAYSTGQIPANLHFSEPRDDIISLKDGKMQVVNEHTPFKGGYTAINCFSFTGIDTHVLLKGYESKQKARLVQSNMPYMVPLSGRTENVLKQAFNKLESEPIDPNQLNLIHRAHSANIKGHVVRGYNILATKDGITVSLGKNMEYYQGIKRPVWFVYSGMGSQWAGMGAQLMRIPVFASAIYRCQKVLEPKGIDLVEIISKPDPKIYDNILNSFVGIAAIQIGLSDILHALGIKPDGIIGHSVGELGCAYADGCFTAEEMILSAYSRGLVSVETPLIKGSMAAVGIGYQQIKMLCPPEIVVACHNGADSSTISGPADIMKTFVKELQDKGIFAKEVPCSNIAYHSKYIAEAGPILLKYLSEVIKEPKRRSSKWVSTSVPQRHWEEPLAQFSSAEYHTNNLLNSVLFEESSRLIPNNALTIEIAPHGLLQAILKRSLGKECIHIPLTRRGHTDSVVFLLEQIGNLYVNGLNPAIENLYPKVEYPLPASTRPLSHLVGWEHSEYWHKGIYTPYVELHSGERHFSMSTFDDEYKFHIGHVINGINTFCPAAQLVLVWETLGMIVNIPFWRLPVVFTDINIRSDIPIPENAPLDLSVMIHRATGNFEIIYNGAAITTGNARPKRKTEQLKDITDQMLGDISAETLKEKDIYTLLRNKSYFYSDQFRSVSNINMTMNKGNVKWNNNWVTYLDGLFQIAMLNKKIYGVSKFKLIEQILIDPKKLSENIVNAIGLNADKMLPSLTVHNTIAFDAFYSRQHKLASTFGVQIIGLETIEYPKTTAKEVVAQKFEFMPYIGQKFTQIKDALQAHVHLTFENLLTDEFVVLEIVENETLSAGEDIKTILDEIPIKDLITRFSSSSIRRDELALNKFKTLQLNEVNLIVISNLHNQEAAINEIYNNTPDSIFILCRETTSSRSLKSLCYPKFQVLSTIETPNETLVLIRKDQNPRGFTKFVNIRSHTSKSWLEIVKKEIKNCQRLVLVCQEDVCLGHLGLINFIRMEENIKNVNLMMTLDENVPAFKAELQIFKDQLQKNLAINIYKNGCWGSYRYQDAHQEPIRTKSVKLTLREAGYLQTLEWIDAPLPIPVHCNQKLVQVYYAAPNYLDVLKATGRLRGGDVAYDFEEFGMGFSGRTANGDRVMGLIRNGALRSVVQADLDLLWPVPEHWSLEEAATVPQAYAHALYCLTGRTKVIPGQSVLIQHGAGALGQAVINICLFLGCEVYTTVSDNNKKTFLMKLFPELKDNIGNSRDSTFMEMVMTSSKGRGCDIVISSATGTLKHLGLECVKQWGVFLDLDKESIIENEKFGMFHLTKNRSHQIVSFSNLFDDKNSDLKRKIQAILVNGISSGFVVPLTSIQFQMLDATKAFQLMSKGQQRGQVLLKLRPEEPTSLPVPPANILFEAVPRVDFGQDGSYVIVTSKNESAFELVHWLIRNGAKNVLVHTRDSLSTNLFKTIEDDDINLKMFHVDLQTEIGCFDLLNECERMGHVMGIFLLHDSENHERVLNTSCEDLSKYFSENAKVTMNMDAASRKNCSYLKYFVILSSLQGEGSYGRSLAYSVAQTICEERCKLKLPALALQYGSSKSHNNNSIDEALIYMETYLKAKYPAAASFYRSSKRPTVKVFDKIISEILGANNIQDLNVSMTLEDLGVDRQTAKQIQIILERDFDKHYGIGRILNLTLKALQSMGSDDRSANKKTGLGLFFTYEHPDELDATEPILGMPSLLSSGDEPEDAFKSEHSRLMVIPGLDNNWIGLTEVTRRCRIRANILPLLTITPAETISGLANNMVKIIKMRMLPGAKFYLLGYSFGATVALEVAAILERHGHVGKIFLLDGAPSMFKVLFQALVPFKEESELQNELILHMHNLVTGDDDAYLAKEIAKFDSWDEKLSAFSKRTYGSAQFTKQFKIALIESAYKRITMTNDFDPSQLPKLQSDIVLIKATKSPLDKNLLEDDYGVSRYSRGPVKIYELDTDHFNIGSDYRVSDIINMELYEKDYWKNINQCEKYTL